MTDINTPSGTLRASSVDKSDLESYLDNAASSQAAIDRRRFCVSPYGRYHHSYLTTYQNISGGIINRDYSIVSTLYKAYRNTSGNELIQDDSVGGMMISCNSDGTAVAVTQGTSTISTVPSATKVYRTFDEWNTFTVSASITHDIVGGFVGSAISSDGNVLLVQAGNQRMDLFYYNGFSYVNTNENIEVFGGNSFANISFALNENVFVIATSAINEIYAYDYDINTGVSNLSKIGTRQSSSDVREPFMSCDGNYVFGLNGTDIIEMPSTGTSSSSSIFRIVGSTNYSIGNRSGTKFSIYSDDQGITLCYRDTSDLSLVVKKGSGTLGTVTVPINEELRLTTSELPWGSSYEYEIKVKNHNQLAVVALNNSFYRSTVIDL